MPTSQQALKRASGYLTLGCAITILISITASQILLGLALATLLASRTRLRLPRIWIPLTFFLAGTFLSMFFSPSPLHGLPQVKKMYVFFTLLVVCSTVTDLIRVRRLVLVWSGIAGLVAIFGLVQVTTRLYELHVQHGDVYEYYVAHRFTGFMSHVMTFSGEDMVVLLMLVSFLFFACDIPKPVLIAGAACAILLGGILLAAGARTVWLGVAVAGLWLLWNWRPWTAVAGPVTILLFLWVVPGPVHDRFLSLVHPRKDVDSNEFRIICIRTGERMIQAHPWLGIGLDETKYHFLDYLPPDTRRPLPPGFYQHLHDIYLQYAAERGVPTLLVFLWLLGIILLDSYRALQRLPEGRSDQRFILHGGIATVIGVMVAGLFEANLADSEVLTMFLVVVACAYTAGEKVLPATIPSGPA